MGNNCLSLVSVRREFEIKAIAFLTSRGINRPRRFLERLMRIPFCHKKLKRLMDGGDLIMPEIDGTNNYFDACFDEFIKQAPQWSREHAAEYSEVFHTFFGDFSLEERTKILIIRRQIGESACCLHAVVTFEHYISALLSKGEVTSTFDVGKYEEFTLRGEDLENFLLRNEGDRAIVSFLSLLVFEEPIEDSFSMFHMCNKKHLPDYYIAQCEYILDRARTQPALVTEMKVTDIHRSSEVIFTEVPRDSPEDPRQAMVLIGARKSKEGEYYFLLQNWWKSRYFIEVSGEYLSGCDAKVYFYRLDRIERQEQFSGFLYHATYAETCVDLPDRSPRDM